MTFSIEMGERFARIFSDVGVSKQDKHQRLDGGEMGFIVYLSTKFAFKFLDRTPLPNQRSAINEGRNDVKFLFN
jgi:hypothetical protein